MSTHTGWQCPVCKKIHAPSVLSCICNIDGSGEAGRLEIRSHSDKVAKWELWGGWCGNHDKRIEGAKCTECGYEHPVVYDTVENLGKFCFNCGSSIIGVKTF